MTQLKKVSEQLERLVKKNSLCRKKRRLKSCFQCSIYDKCKSNNYDTILEQKRKLEKI